jgi:hypothetical protein
LGGHRAARGGGMGENAPKLGGYIVQLNGMNPSR